MDDAKTTLQDVKDAIRQFTQQRDWQQFHNLKNLSMAIATEAAELMAHFRWIDDVAAGEVMNDDASAREVRHEVADVLLLLAEFANVAKIDMALATDDKMKLNAQRYPVEKAKGVALKYDRL